MARLNITYKQCFACASPTILPWQDPHWPSVEFTGRSAESRNEGVWEDAWGGLRELVVAWAE